MENWNEHGRTWARAWLRRTLALGALLALAGAAGCEEPLPETDSDESSVNDEDDSDDEGDKSEDESDGENDDTAKPKTEGSSSRDAGGSKTTGTKDAGMASTAGDSGAVTKADSTADSANGAGWCKAKAIFDQYCTSCHDGEGGGGSPMGLVKFADMTAAAPVTTGKKVYEVVGTRVHDSAKPMPPKKMLAAAELKVLDEWIAAGAPAGADPTCASQASSDSAKPSDGRPVSIWKPEDCDEVYKVVSHGSGGSDTPYMVPPGQEIHPQVMVDAPWGNESVQAINFRPITDNKKVLHHWILYANSGGFLTGWAPGDDARSPLPDDVGMEMPTGARAMRLDMHYFNTQGTQSEPDQSGLEICVLKKEHARKNVAAVTMSLNSFGPILAPANTQNHEATGTCNVTASQPVHLLTASPHAHKYAKHMKFTVKKKNGEQIVMHDQPFIFGEQGSYPLSPDVVVETGDTITTTCVFSNDTNKSITFGESTENEMCFNFAVYYPKGGLSCGGGLGGLLGGF